MTNQLEAFYLDVTIVVWSQVLKDFDVGCQNRYLYVYWHTAMFSYIPNTVMLNQVFGSVLVFSKDRTSCIPFKKLGLPG